MGLQQFERRLERMVEGVFARVLRGGLQPVEIGRRLTREMDLRRTVAPKGVLAPNDFVVVLSPSDRSRFASIEDELVDELIAVARDHADVERYSFLGPITVVMETDDSLAPGMVLVSGEIHRAEPEMPPSRRREAPYRGDPYRDEPYREEPYREEPYRDERRYREAAAEARLALPDGQVLRLGREPVSLGRLPDCSVVLADPNVSRRHAEIRAFTLEGERQYEVVDLGSTNGTKVNGMPVKGRRVLADGDQITMGATTIGFDYR